MSNPVFTDVVFVGDMREVRSLYGKMKRLEERKQPLEENGCYWAKRWLGYLVARLGEDWHEVYCRGTWKFLRKTGHSVLFLTETAWKPPFELFKMIQRHYPSLQFYFEAEGEEWDAYITNDIEGHYFPYRYIIDCEPDIEYFNTIEAAAAHLSTYIGKCIVPTWESLNNAADEWNNKHKDSDWPVNVKQIEVIDNHDI